MVIFDKDKQRMIEYNSHTEFDYRVIAKLATTPYK